MFGFDVLSCSLKEKARIWGNINSKIKCLSEPVQQKIRLHSPQKNICLTSTKKDARTAPMVTFEQIFTHWVAI